jgi:hypothetical protein
MRAVIGIKRNDHVRNQATREELNIFDILEIANYEAH